MEKFKEIIPIFFSIDNSYAPLLGTALFSMLQNASETYQYKVFVLYKELSAQNKEKLLALQTENGKIYFVEMEDRLGLIKDRMFNRLRADYFTLTIYFRLFIPVMFPQYDKGIYLDSDIVVTGDISELYQTELGENLLGAAVDPAIVNIPQLARHAELCVGVDRNQYFNSGVLLMNLKKLREMRFDERFLELLNKYHFDTIAPDQDYLNAMCSGRITYLSPVWDAMPSEAAMPLEAPNLIHYNLFAKPWYYDGVQYGEYFWPYAEKCGFFPEILAMKAGYTEKEKQADREHLALLLSRGNASGDGEVTFRTIFNEGKEARL